MAVFSAARQSAYSRYPGVRGWKTPDLIRFRNQLGMNYASGTEIRSGYKVGIITVTCIQDSNGVPNSDVGYFGNAISYLY